MVTFPWQKGKHITRKPTTTPPKPPKTPQQEMDDALEDFATKPTKVVLPPRRRTRQSGELGDEYVKRGWKKL
jgi:hypothetical protein